VRTVADFSCTGKKVLVRVDFNVPLSSDFHVTDDTRIREALPTIRKILADQGAVILMSHLGRPKNGYEEKFSLKHVVPVLASALRTDVHFADDCVGGEASAKATTLKPNQILLLENLRFHSEESAGDESFAKQLAALGEVYINDAFGSAHRAHASTAVIAKFFQPERRMFGLLMAKEVENAHRVLHESKKPMTLVLGGAKVSDKIKLIRSFIPLADNIIIGGGMAFTFIKAQGGEIGNSLFEEALVNEALEVLRLAVDSNTQIHLPTDAIVAERLDADAKTKTVNANAIPSGWMGLDIGLKSAKALRKVIRGSKTIVWNGPMGVFEIKPFREGTVVIAKAIARATSKGAFSLAGGGDSVAVLNQLKLKDKMSYVSTGGGAMLAMLEGRELPGILAIGRS